MRTPQQLCDVMAADSKPSVTASKWLPGFQTEQCAQAGQRTSVSLFTAESALAPTELPETVTSLVASGATVLLAGLHTQPIEAGS